MPHEQRPKRIRPGTILSNIYISNLPKTVSRKYANADDQAMMLADGDWQGVFSKDMETVSKYSTSRLGT